MGITLDSTESVRKNQIMPKEMGRNFLNRMTAKTRSETTRRKEKKVGNSKKCRAIG